MLRTQLAGAVIAALLVCGCGEAPKTALPTTDATTPGGDGQAQTGVAVAQPELEVVPAQTEPGDADFPRGAEAFAQLVKAAEANDADDWAKAEARLQELGPQATAALAERLADENPVARELAAMFLAQIGPDASQAAEGLVKLLQDESTFARVNAAAALSTFDGYAEQATPVLTALLKDPDANIRVTAATSLRNLGPAAVTSVSALARTLDDENPQVRAAAATSLGEIGLDAAGSLPALRRLATDSDETVVTAAIQAIGRIDGSAVDRTARATPASATE